MSRPFSRPDITPEVLLGAYRCGQFPMAESADDPSLFWVNPKERGILPIDGFHVPRRLRRTVAKDRYEVRVDHDFDAVISGCAMPGEDREKTWINDRIRRIYGELFDLGHCHTVEAWRDGRLVGGLYGVELGAAFFGESMFHLEPDASKVALVHLVARLRRGRFLLLDTQFVTEHLMQFGAVEISRTAYHRKLDAAVADVATWWSFERGRIVSGADALAQVNEKGE